MVENGILWAPVRTAPVFVDRKERKEEGIDEDIAAERENVAEISRQRDDDDLADQVGGGDPGAVIDTCADAALDIEKRGIGDLDIEDRHEGADHTGENGDPFPGTGLAAGARLRDGAGCCCDTGHDTISCPFA